MDEMKRMTRDRDKFRKWVENPDAYRNIQVFNDKEEGYPQEIWQSLLYIKNREILTFPAFFA